jgi:ADP-heptose:LPS heptosyltransferase
MKLGTKLLIDRIVGSLIVGVLVRTSRPRREDSAGSITPDHIVVLKLLGLGSIVQATPLVAALKKRYGDADFTFITRNGNDGLTSRIGLIGHTFTIDDSSLIAVVRTLWRTLRRVRRMSNVCFINLEAYSNVGVVMTLLSGARWTAGFFRNPSDFKLDRAFDVLVYFNPGAPISQVYLQVGRAMGCAELAPSLAHLTTNESDHHEVDVLLRHAGALDGPVIVVNPNSSELRLERRWPSERFARVISDLLKALPTSRVMLIGAPHERAYTESLRDGVDEEARSRVHNTAGELSLGGLIRLIERSKLLITNDSGPMHFAFSVGTPTVSLFGPVEPGHYAFPGDDSRHAILYQRVYCSPCVHHFDVAPCRGDNVCMKRIGHDDVLSMALSLLSDARVQADASPSIVYTHKGRALGVLSHAR